MKAELISKLLKGTAAQKGEYLCCCPNHEDKKPSFSVKDISKGRVAMKCFAGCKQDDLFKKVKELYEAEYGKEEFIRKEVKTTNYVYQNEKGEDELKIVRVDFNDYTKDFKQMHLSNGSWSFGGSTNATPYKHEDWKELSAIVFVEGEKCAEKCWENNIAATCIPGGASAWNERYAKYFSGKDVIIIPDNDSAGEELSGKVYDALISSCQPMIVHLPDLEEKEDIVEWFEKGNTKQNLFDIAIEVKKQPMVGMGLGDEFTNTDYVDQIQDQNAKGKLEFGIPFLDDAWGGLLPDDLCVFASKSGYGKTQQAMNTAKSVVSKGGKVAFFALEAFRNEIGMRAIYTLAVDKYVKQKKHTDPYASFGDWLIGNPRLRSAMKPFTDAAKVEAKEFWGNKFFTYYVDNRFTIDEFEKRFFIMAKNVNLIILDHLHYIAKDPKQSAADHISETMSRIKALVNKYHVPVIIISHLRKEDSGERKPVPDSEDLHGSSDIFKIATKVVMFGRPLDGGFNLDTGEQVTYFRSTKDRTGTIKDWQIGKLIFDSNKQVYKDEYEVIKLMRKNKDWEEIPLAKKLHWQGRSKIKQEGMFYDV